MANKNPDGVRLDVARLIATDENAARDIADNPDLDLLVLAGTLAAGSPIARTIVSAAAKPGSATS